MRAIHIDGFASGGLAKPGLTAFDLIMANRRGGGRGGSATAAASSPSEYICVLCTAQQPELVGCRLNTINLLVICYRRVHTYTVHTGTKHMDYMRVCLHKGVVLVEWGAWHVCVICALAHAARHQSIETSDTSTQSHTDRKRMRDGLSTQITSPYKINRIHFSGITAHCT